MDQTNDQTFDDLIRAIETKAKGSKHPFIIAIDGKSGVGKSTLARHVAEKLDVPILESDDFYAGGTALRTDPLPALMDACIDWRSLKNTLILLKDMGRAEFQAFDWQAFDGSMLDRHIALSSSGFAIVEGVYTARSELRSLIDFTILVDTPEKARHDRLLAREGEIGPWERQWHKAEDWYFEHVIGPNDVDFIFRL